jgi:ABC-type glycerol-3-phosphate transport system permease component
MGHGIAIKVMLLTPAFRNMDASLEEAARASGAGTLRTMMRVTLPLMISPMVLVFALTEVGIIIVAAVAVATMNYIFFTQRREEFGVLHAVGRSRRWLVLRTMRETSSMVVVAWLLSAVVYVISLVCVQAIVYVPRGLSLNIFNPIPWLFTLPIPLTVVLASTGTIGRMLRKLDPVTIIERR